MKVSQMFPSKYLTAEDLPTGRNTLVTIERVYPVAARSNAYGDEPETKWMMRLAEFRKPMTLWRTNAKLIADVMGTDDTDQWIGRRIAIFPSTYTSFGEIKPCINVDPQWRDTQPRPPAGTALVVAHDTRPIPAEAMQRFFCHLSKHGKRWDDFLAWCKANSQEALTMAFGQGMEAIPSGILPAMKAFLDSLSLPADAGAKVEAARTAGYRELVDGATGEVISGGRPPDPVGEEDIPF